MAGKGRPGPAVLPRDLLRPDVVVDHDSLDRSGVPSLRGALSTETAVWVSPYCPQVFYGPQREWTRDGSPSLCGGVTHLPPL